VTMGAGEGGLSILVENLRFSYPKAPGDAIGGVDCKFEGGTLCVVLGRNGSGKSTLARCLNGLLLPTGGRVVTCGLDTSETANRPEIRKSVAMVFQNPDTQLVATTVEEEVAFGPENLGLEPPIIRERVDHALEVVGITSLARRQPLRLSQGQKQLVALAGALAMKPAFLVSDESTSMLDYASRLRVLELFEYLRAMGIGVIHITHFLEEAAMADSVLVLEDGLLAAQGKPAEVLGEPERVRSLGLDPLAVTVVAHELGKLGHPAPQDILDVKELMAWLNA
jgi:energy-coupling factor transport system ATP-binding protein